MFIVDNLSLSKELKTKLWYSDEETDLFKAWFYHRVREVRSQLKDHSAFINQEGVSINAAAILGLERYLNPKLTAEYRDRRLALQGAVLAEQRWHQASQAPHSARLAMVSAQHSEWARERARAAGLFLEQDVKQDDFQDMKLQTNPPPCSMTHLNGADTTEEERKAHPYQRLWSGASWTSIRNGL